ncbi:unnamed protein product [Pylaiella littoralis]
MCPLAKALSPGMSAPESTHGYELARRHLREEMEKLATYAEELLSKDKAAMVSFAPCRFQTGTGMMSYPNFNGDDKAIQYVDFQLLAEEAERAGVDLRIIYLSRSARSILISDTQHNNYGKTFIRESRILINSADVVASTFQELDPGFTTCFRYEDMADPTQANRVASFAAPNVWIADRLGKKLISHVKAKPSPQPKKAAAPRVQWDQQHQHQQQQWGARTAAVAVAANDSDIGSGARTAARY